MRRDWDEVESLVRDRVCGRCAPRRDACEASPAGRCALFELFPLVVQAILATDSREAADYQAALRENVCAVCNEAALDLSCPLREQVRCALDLYLAEVVQVIQEAAKQPAVA